MASMSSQMMMMDPMLRQRLPGAWGAAGMGGGPAGGWGQAAPRQAGQMPALPTQPTGPVMQGGGPGLTPLGGPPMPPPQPAGVSPGVVTGGAPAAAGAMQRPMAPPSPGFQSAQNPWGGAAGTMQGLPPQQATAPPPPPQFQSAQNPWGGAAGTMGGLPPIQQSGAGQWGNQGNQNQQGPTGTPPLASSPAGGGGYNPFAQAANQGPMAQQAAPPSVRPNDLMGGSGFQRLRRPMM
jgi:hypothetical protein